VPCRNLILASLAASHAVKLGIKYIAHGNIAGGAYPDNQCSWTVAMNNVLKESLTEENKVTVLAPTNTWSKETVAGEAIRLKVPLQYTWSCYLNGVHHCGECASCKSRRNAFALINRDDGITYAK